MAAEVEKLLKEAVEGIEIVQKTLDIHEGKLAGLDQEVIAKATEGATKAMEGIQKIEEQSKAIEAAAKQSEERVEALELLIAAGKGGDATTDPAYRNAFSKYLRRGTEIDNDTIEQACKSMTEKALVGATEDEILMFTKDLLAGSNPDGGFWLQTDRADFISTRIFETSPIRGLARVVSTQNDMFEVILDDDEFASASVGEVEARDDTDTSEIGLVKIPVHEIYAQPRVTQKMLDDAGFNLESWIVDKAGRKIGRQENTNFVLGSGSKGAKGFLTYDAWTAAGVYQRDAVEQISSGEAAALDGDGLIDLQSALLEEYQANAQFGMRRATFGDVMKLKDGQGQYILHSRFINEGAPKMLLGNGVTFMSDMPAVAADALAVVFADFEEFYTIVDRFGVRVLRDPYTAKPYVRFYTTKRSGGAVTNFQAGKIQKIEA